MSHPLHDEIEAHWREHLPRMVAEMERDGTLQQSIEAKVELIRCMEASLCGAGLYPFEIREITNEIAYLPAEEDREPEVPYSLDPMHMPEPPE